MSTIVVCKGCGLAVEVRVWPLRCSCGRITNKDGSCAEVTEYRRGKPVVRKGKR